MLLVLQILYHLCREKNLDLNLFRVVFKITECFNNYLININLSELHFTLLCNVWQKHLLGISFDWNFFKFIKMDWNSPKLTDSLSHLKEIKLLILKLNFLKDELMHSLITIFTRNDSSFRMNNTPKSKFLLKYADNYMKNTSDCFRIRVCV